MTAENAAMRLRKTKMRAVTIIPGMENKSAPIVPKK